MNSAYLTKDLLADEPKKDASVILREKSERLSETLEALQNVAGSTYWKVLQKNVFNVDLSRAKRRLATEKDTIEIFRLQGEIAWAEKLDLEKLITKYREELKVVIQKLNDK